MNSTNFYGENCVDIICLHFCKAFCSVLCDTCVKRLTFFKISVCWTNLIWKQFIERLRKLILLAHHPVDYSYLMSPGIDLQPVFNIFSSVMWRKILLRHAWRLLGTAQRFNLTEQTVRGYWMLHEKLLDMMDNTPRS